MDKLSKGLLILFILFASSCEKKPTSTNIDDTIIFGTVVDSKTNQPIQGVSILKIGHCNDLSFYDTSFVTQTDKDGKFQFKQKLTYSTGDPIEACYSYFVAHYKDYSDGQVGVKIGAITESNIKLVKNSYLKIHLKNATPYNSSDWFNFGVGSNNGWSQPYWSFYNSNNLDTILIINVIPNYTHSIWWNATKNNIKTSGSENVYFTSGDTVYRAILY